MFWHHYKPSRRMAMKKLDYDYCHTAPGIYKYVLLVVCRLFNRAGKGTNLFRFGRQYEELALITSFFNRKLRRIDTEKGIIIVSRSSTIRIIKRNWIIDLCFRLKTELRINPNYFTILNYPVNFLIYHRNILQYQSICMIRFYNNNI